MNEKNSFAFDSLEAVRKKLLDLSGRNALINYKHPKASCVRIIDELPDQVAQLLQKGKSLTFIPVPEPTERELINAGYIVVDAQTGQKRAMDYPTAEQWARHIGLVTNYDLPSKLVSDNAEGKHQDTNLQTVFYAPELEARLRGLRHKSETAIEENGANILFLSLGFLEWYESRDSDLARLAPLMTLPVRLERTLARNGGSYRYTITLKDDAVITNITLREKLANDFGLTLPAVDDDLLPETYFEQIQDTVLELFPRWCIRRQATLALLNFSKQAMYEDLNPDNWPEGHSIQDHPIISQFFGAAKEGDSGGALNYAEEHVIDHIEDVHDRFPLIYDADSSQHSALIDAVKGENLVIEGPPGSGKSQTITNLIAACIANGKKVLFVAEKMAALNVVKDRLDKAGLGDFCLELHSHKTQKQKILSDLNNRLNKQSSYRTPKSIEVDIACYEDLRQTLHRYVELINSPWRETGLTIHQIFNKATRYREQLNLDPDELSIDGIDGHNLTPIFQRRLVDQAEMLASIYDQVSEQAPGGFIFNHYWYGVNNIEITGYQSDSLGKSLSDWTGSLRVLSKGWYTLNEEFHFDSNEDAPLETITVTSDVLDELPELLGGEPLGQLIDIIEGQDEYASMLVGYSIIHQKVDSLGEHIKRDQINDESTQSRLTDALRIFKQMGVKGQLTLQDLVKDSDDLAASCASVEGVITTFRSMVSSLPGEMHPAFAVTAEGLREFIVLVELIDQLPVDLWRYRDALYDDPDLDTLVEQITQSFEKLLPLQGQLFEYFSLHRLPSTAELKSYQETLSSDGLFRWFSSDWRKARKAVLDLGCNAKQNKSALLDQLPALIDYSAGMASLDQVHHNTPILGELYRGIETQIERISTLRKWYKAVRLEYGIGFGDRVEIGNGLVGLDRNLVLSIADVAQHGLIESCRELLSSIDLYRERYREFGLVSDGKLRLDGEQSPLALLKQKIEDQLSALHGLFKGYGYTVGDIAKLTESLSNIQKLKSNWHKKIRPNWFDVNGITLSVDAGSYSEQALSVAKNTLEIAKVINKSQTLLNAVEFDSSADCYHRLVACNTDLKTMIADVENKAEEFETQGEVDFTAWGHSSKGAINSLVERNERALENPLWLNTWLDYIRLCKKLSTQGMGNVLDSLESKNIHAKELRNVLELVISHQLANEILGEHETLSSFIGIEQMAVRDKFQEYDRKLLRLQQQKIAFKASRTTPPAGTATGKVSSYSETALIRHEGGKKSRLIAVRSLIKRAGNAISALKPCFMMSPMSVAQYLEPGQFKFDLVVMDEASQIRPEDALGAIARGTNLVVVGDPKQLPPTSFFQKVIDQDDDDEDIVALQESESILDCVIPMFKTRRLRWHYRSRHESLIAFSNKQFYDSNLILFPSPFQESEEFGIRFSRIENGRFNNRRNVEEAKVVVRAVAEQLINNPDESVGVVAMNSEQRDEIERQLDQLIKDEPRLQMPYERNQAAEDPLFIKNLENVQGDERDVIIISMTYGPDQIGGRVMQRFGPINSDVGWRRLNVLFTRSKKRMHILSSMGSGDIIAAANSSRGVTSLKAFLDYCETGHLHQAMHTGKAADSDFEIAVMQALAEYGYECEPQLGVAGYFLDLAVKDPGLPGRFLMAVECDGATYHSAKSTRDRDRLRQDILESLGWKVRRIWSTDWFKNPQAQLQPILADLELLRTPFVEYDTDQPDSSTVISFDETPLEDEKKKTHVSEEDEAYLSPTAEGEQIDLKERLLRFDYEVIRKAHPDTDDAHRLLRVEMLESIIEHLPCSKSEFVECIPGYLRFGTSEEEGGYLGQVLDLVAEFG